MLRIRAPQLAVLTADVSRRRVREIVEEETTAILAAPEEWPEVFPWTEREELAACVGRVAERGVRDRGVIRAYVRMAATLGLDFESRDEHAWLVARLDDRAVTSPDERVRLAHEEWVRRMRLAEENARREEEFLRRAGRRR